MSIKPVQNQFNGGELSPLMGGRFDLPAYQYSSELMLNFIPSTEGYFKRRGGTRYVAEAKSQEALIFKINPTPDDAKVIIDDALTKEVSCAYGDVVNYMVSSENYTTVYGQYKMTENKELDVLLASNINRYKVTIVPYPEDALVYINGIQRKEASIGENGTVDWLVEKDGYDTVSGSFIAQENKTLSIVLTVSFEIVCLDRQDAKIVLNGVETNKIQVNIGDIVSWTVSDGELTKSGQTVISGSQVEYVLLDEDGEVFNYTGQIQSYVVPKKVNKLEVDCVGAAGNGSNGGKGGRVQCVLKVEPEETIYIYVGGKAAAWPTASYNASDIRRINGAVTSNVSLNSRLVVAGGGGSYGWGNTQAKGGDGGGISGAAGERNGPSGCGYGGSQSAGGAGGVDHPWTSQATTLGNKGEFGLGGVGVQRVVGYGGSGGAGWYGGGSGAGTNTKKAGNYGGGGGGGSSYTNASRCSNVIHTQGYAGASADGYVQIKPIFEG